MTDTPPPPRREATPRPILLALLVVTLAALFLRLRANDYSLPHQPEPDAVIVWQSAWFDRPEGCEEMAPYAYPAPFYPFLLAKLLAALPGPGYPVLQPYDAAEEAHLAAAGLRYVRGRTLIAWLSVLAIPALFLVARRFLEPGWALLAAAFLATSLLNHSYSMQARPHTASAALSLFALVAALRLLRRPTWLHYLAGSAGAFVTIGAFQNGVFVLPSLLLAHLWAPRRNWAALALSALLVAAVIPVFYPFLWEAGLEGIFGGEKVEVGGQVLAPEVWSGGGYLQMLQGFWGYEPLLSVLAGLGLVLGIARLASRRTRPSKDSVRALAVVAAFPVAFVLVWGIWTVVPARFVNPLIPFLALLAAFAAREVLVRLVPARVSWRRPALVAGALTLLALPAFASARLSALRAQDDTYRQAARWLEGHVDRERQSVALEILLYLPLPQRQESLEALPAWAWHAWDFYQLELLRRVDRAELALQVLWRADAELCAALAGGGGARGACARTVWLHPWGRLLLARSAERDARRFTVHPLFDAEFFADRNLSGVEIAMLIDRHEPDWIVTFGQARDAADQRKASMAARMRYGAPVARFLPFDERSELPGSGYELGFEGFARVMRSSAWGPPIEIYRRPSELPGR